MPKHPCKKSCKCANKDKKPVKWQQLSKLAPKMGRLVRVVNQRKHALANPEYLSMKVEDEEGNQLREYESSITYPVYSGYDLKYFPVH